MKRFDKSNVDERCSIEITCSVNYSGNWAPVITWQQDGDSVDTADVVNKTVLYQSVTSSLTILVTGNGIGSTVSCITHFSDDNNPSDTTNVLNNGSSVPRYNSTKFWKLFGEESTGNYRVYQRKKWDIVII